MRKSRRLREFEFHAAPVATTGASALWQRRESPLPSGKRSHAALFIAEPTGGDHPLRAVYASQGEAISANEEEIDDVTCAGISDRHMIAAAAESMRSSRKEAT